MFTSFNGGLCAVLLDFILFVIFAAVVVWAAKRGFFATALRLGAWIVSIAVARVLGSALAPPLYEALAAQPIRRMIESNIDGAVNSSQAAQYARQLIADLPDALSQLAARVGGVTADSLIDNLDTQQFTAANAAQLLEQSIIAPIGIAVIRLALSLLLFVLLLFVTRLILGKLEKIRRLPLLKQADSLLGAALGLVKGVLLLLILVLVLRAAAALSQEGSVFAEMVDASRIVSLLSFSAV